AFVQALKILRELWPWLRHFALSKREKRTIYLLFKTNKSDLLKVWTKFQTFVSIQQPDRHPISSSSQFLGLNQKYSFICSEKRISLYRPNRLVHQKRPMRAAFSSLAVIIRNALRPP